MAVAPNRLKRIAADVGHTNELESVWSQRPVGMLINIAQNIDFALAPRARTTPAQGCQRNIAFPAIRPFDGQFIADALNV